MTRKEQKEQKLAQEKAFIESIKGKCITSQEKDKFRNTTEWKDFRNKFKNSIDPITLRKVPKRFQLHHMCLSPVLYTDLNPKHFLPLNGTTHDILHYLYSYYRKDRKILKRLQKCLDLMVELNDGKDIIDFKKENKNQFL